MKKSHACMSIGVHIDALSIVFMHTRARTHMQTTGDCRNSIACELAAKGP